LLQTKENERLLIAQRRKSAGAKAWPSGKDSRTSAARSSDNSMP
jgi:hypothetical protein